MGTGGYGRRGAGGKYSVERADSSHWRTHIRQSVRDLSNRHPHELHCHSGRQGHPGSGFVFAGLRQCLRRASEQHQLLLRRLLHLHRCQMQRGHRPVCQRVPPAAKSGVPLRDQQQRPGRESALGRVQRHVNHRLHLLWDQYPEQQHVDGRNRAPDRRLWQHHHGVPGCQHRQQLHRFRIQRAVLQFKHDSALRGQLRCHRFLLPQRAHAIDRRAVGHPAHNHTGVGRGTVLH